MLNIEWWNVQIIAHIEVACMGYGLRHLILYASQDHTIHA